MEEKRLSVNYAKDWLDQLFPFPGIVRSGKGFHLGLDHYGAVNNHFPVYKAIFGMVTTEQTNNRVILEHACS